MSHAGKTVLITDLDDTLWDWLNIWYSSFYPMFEETLRITGVDRDELISVIKAIHERQGTSEYTFLLQDIERHYGRQTSSTAITEKYDSAIHAFRSGRKQAQKLFSGVEETLRHVKERGAKIVAYTESQAYPTIQRLQAFNLDGIIDILYSPEDHDRPHDVKLEDIRSKDASEYKLQRTIHHHTPRGELKPNPDILQSIINELGESKDRCVYVGDKLVKDVKMAQDAGVLDVWAKYGSKIDSNEYDFLKKVTHWTPTAVVTEARAKAVDATSTTSALEDQIQVSITLHSGYSELLEHVEFEPFSSKSKS